MFINRCEGTKKRIGFLLYNLESDAEGMFVFVPVGAKHFETAYLGGGADMASDAGADVVVADADQSDGVGGILWQTVGTDLRWQFVARDELEVDRQVVVDELLHLAFNLLFLLTGRLVVEVEAHLALLALDVGIIGAFAAEDANHGLIQEVFGRVRWRKLLFVMLVQYIVFHLTSSIIHLTSSIITLSSSRHAHHSQGWSC